MLKSHEELWDALLKTALLGTERHALVWPTNVVGGDEAGEGKPDSDVTALAHALDLTDQEGTLLGTAAAISLYRSAGRIPDSSNEKPPEPCAPDDLPSCGSRAGARLALLLQGSNSALLLEWLAIAAQTGQRVPEALLPDLLDAGRQHADWRDAIALVLGQRGRWLATHNSAWSYVAGEVGDYEETWQTGNKAARLYVLRHLREQNPEQARTMLMQTWDEESPKDRADFLQALAINLTMADEPFLETTLTDRRKEVRTVAVDLLSHLPESRMAQRMIERLRPLLKLERKRKLRGLLKETVHIAVTLPDSFDKTMERDGIQQKPVVGGKRIGEKAWWLQQMVALTPLNYWNQEWNLTPAEIIQAARAGEWGDLLIEGFSQAAQHQQHAPWLEAFLSEAVSDKIFSAPQLLQGLPAERVEAFILSLLESAEGPPANLEILLLHCQRPWSTSFTRAILAMARRDMDIMLATPKLQYHWLYSNLKEFAFYIPVDMIEEVIKDWEREETPDDYRRHSIEEFLEILHFRADMVRELRMKK